MKFQGKIYKDGKFWLAEIPFLQLMTQGYTKKEVTEMVEDLFRTLANKNDFEVNVTLYKNGYIEIGSNDTNAMIRILLQRKRQISGLSLSQVAKKLGSSSKNSYARYEQGRSTPSLEKLNKILHVLSPESDFVMTQSGLL